MFWCVHFEKLFTNYICIYNELFFSMSQQEWWLRKIDGRDVNPEVFATDILRATFLTLVRAIKNKILQTSQHHDFFCVYISNLSTYYRKKGSARVRKVPEGWGLLARVAKGVRNRKFLVIQISQLGSWMEALVEAVTIIVPMVPMGLTSLDSTTSTPFIWLNLRLY